MVAQLGKKLGAGGGGASSVTCGLDVVASDATGSTSVGDTAEEASGPGTHGSRVGTNAIEEHSVQELLAALQQLKTEHAAKDAELAAKDAKLAAQDAKLAAQDLALVDLRDRVAHEDPPV